jgi:hypothetical protein
MKKSRIAFVLAFAPAIVAAQSVTSTASGSASADIPSSYSAESKAKLNATFSAARERRVPEQPIRDRIAEGQAKGASEAQVVLAAQRTEARLEAAQSAMLRAGRQPSDAELIRAEQAMVQGATEAQIEVLARRTAPDQSVVVTLDAVAVNTNANAGVNATVATPKAGASAAVTGAAAATTGAGAASVTGAVTAGVGPIIKPPHR